MKRRYAHIDSYVGMLPRSLTESSTTEVPARGLMARTPVALTAEYYDTQDRSTHTYAPSPATLACADWMPEEIRA